MWLFLDVVLALLLAGFLIVGIQTGLLYNLLNVYLIGKCLLEIALTIYRAVNGNFNVNYWQEAIAAQGNLYWLQLVVQTVFFVSIAVYILSVLPKDAFSAGEYQFFYWLTVGLAGVIVLLLAVPNKHLAWPQLVVMVLFIGFMVKEHVSFYQGVDKNNIALINPFKSEAMIVQGGASVLYNHHYQYKPQRWAVDMILPSSSKSMMDRTSLSDFACYGANLYAPIDGKIVRINDELPDVAIGDSDTKNLAGNYVVIETAHQQYVMLAHLKANSVEVEQGEQVIAGQSLLAQCGNSGNTTEPHLHMQIQDHPDFEQVRETWPFNFVNQDGTLTPARAKQLAH